jgi:hypothetical protein
VTSCHGPNMVPRVAPRLAPPSNCATSMAFGFCGVRHIIVPRCHGCEAHQNRCAESRFPALGCTAGSDRNPQPFLIGRNGSCRFASAAETSRFSTGGAQPHMEEACLQRRRRPMVPGAKSPGVWSQQRGLEGRWIALRDDTHAAARAVGRTGNGECMHSVTPPCTRAEEPLASSCCALLR